MRCTSGETFLKKLRKYSLPIRLVLMLGVRKILQHIAQLQFVFSCCITLKLTIVLTLILKKNLSEERMLYDTWCQYSNYIKDILKQITFNIKSIFHYFKNETFILAVLAFYFIFGYGYHLFRQMFQSFS